MHMEHRSYLASSYRSTYIRGMISATSTTMCIIAQKDVGTTTNGVANKGHGMMEILDYSVPGLAGVVHFEVGEYRWPLPLLSRLAVQIPP
jgi:hypothetical protein